MRCLVLYGFCFWTEVVFMDGPWMIECYANCRLFNGFFCSTSRQEKQISEAEIIDAS